LLINYSFRDRIKIDPVGKLLLISVEEGKLKKNPQSKDRREPTTKSTYIWRNHKNEMRSLASKSFG
jgi:hypothetical protein